MTISELFGTLQESVTAQWRKHLQTNKYSSHMALDEFYKEMPEKVDALIEAYQADNDIVKDYKNILDEGLDAVEYLQKLKEITKEGRKLLGSSELESLCDDILSQIDSTLYKLKHLTEARSLRDYLMESILSENPDIEADPGALIEYIGDVLEKHLGYKKQPVGLGWQGAVRWDSSDGSIFVNVNHYEASGYSPESVGFGIGYNLIKDDKLREAKSGKKYYPQIWCSFTVNFYKGKFDGRVEVYSNLEDPEISAWNDDARSEVYSGKREKKKDLSASAYQDFNSLSEVVPLIESYIKPFASITSNRPVNNTLNSVEKATAGKLVTILKKLEPEWAWKKDTR
jgi:aryl carrier-like protein